MLLVTVSLSLLSLAIGIVAEPIAHAAPPKRSASVCVSYTCPSTDTVGDPLIAAYANPNTTPSDAEICAYHDPSYGSKTCPYNANGNTATDSAVVTGGGSYDGYCQARMAGNTACPSTDIFGQALESTSQGQLGCSYTKPGSTTTLYSCQYYFPSCQALSSNNPACPSTCALSPASGATCPGLTSGGVALNVNTITSVPAGCTYANAINCLYNSVTGIYVGDFYDRSYCQLSETCTLFVSEKKRDPKLTKRTSDWVGRKRSFLERKSKVAFKP